jgi:hypothetical protein
MIGRFLCWLGFHREDPACTFVQTVHWPDGDGRSARAFRECARCHHPWSRPKK